MRHKTQSPPVSKSSTAAARSTCHDLFQAFDDGHHDRFDLRNPFESGISTRWSSVDSAAEVRVQNSQSQVQHVHSGYHQAGLLRALVTLSQGYATEPLMALHWVAGQTKHAKDHFENCCT